MTRTRKKPFAANLASRKMMEADGWTVEVVEQRIPHCFITRDFGGFADLLCYRVGKGVIAVQVTGGNSNSNANARIAKIRNEPRAGIWLASSPFNRIQVHNWKGNGGKRECVVTEIESLNQP